MSQRTPPLLLLRDNMDAPTALFHHNSYSIVDKLQTFYYLILNWWHFYLQNKTADDICTMVKHHNNTAESKETYYNVKWCHLKNGSGTDWIFAAHGAA